MAVYSVSLPCRSKMSMTRQRMEMAIGPGVRGVGGGEGVSP